MATYREEQDQFYAELCKKYGDGHAWNLLTDDEKIRMNELKRLARQEYKEEIRL